MPEPGKAITPFGRRLSSSSLRRNGRGASVAVPVRLADDLVDAVALGPARGDLLDAGAAAVHEHHVAMLGAGLVEHADHRGRVGDVLAAGDGDQGALGQVRRGLAVLPRAHEVAGVDCWPRSACRSGWRGCRDGAARCRRSPRGRLGDGVAHLLERVAAVAEVPGAVGDQLQLARLDLGAVLGASAGRAAPG